MKAKVSEELKIFNDIQMLNWAWIYESEDGFWYQFDCIPCMILESKWRQWLKDKSVTCVLIIGTIHFDTMTAKKKVNG